MLCNTTASQDNAAYFYAGQRKTFEPLAIEGFAAPTAQTVALKTGDNTVTFAYQSLYDPGNTNAGDSTTQAGASSANDPLASTGTNLIAILAASLTLITLAVIGLFIRQLRAKK